MLWPRSGGAQEIYLNWDECGPSGSATHTSACDTDIGGQALYCSFSLDQALDQVVGVEITVDLQHQLATLPDWWQLGVDGCRFGALHADGGTPAGTGCADFWDGMATGDVQVFAVGQPRGAPNQARILVALALLPADKRTLEAGPIYYAGRIVLSNLATTGASACDGCGPSACLVLNSIIIKRLPGAPGGDVTLDTPGAGNGNLATWQGTGANCFAVPTQRISWGRLKALYR